MNIYINEFLETTLAPRPNEHSGKLLKQRTTWQGVEEMAVLHWLWNTMLDVVYPL